MYLPPVTIAYSQKAPITRQMAAMIERITQKITRWGLAAMLRPSAGEPQPDAGPLPLSMTARRWGHLSGPMVHPAGDDNANARRLPHGGRRAHKVVLVRADSLRPLEPPEAYKAVPRRVRSLDGQIRGTS
jgi:hypothetical protein